MSVYAHVALHRFSLLPGDFLDLDSRERAFIIASIQVELAKEKKQADKMNK